jgi:hypothetical protein
MSEEKEEEEKKIFLEGKFSGGRRLPARGRVAA